MFRPDRFLTLHCVAPLHRFANRTRPAIPVLMYHSISDAPEPGYPYYWINTTVHRFREHMQFLKEQGYCVISLDEAVRILRSESGYHDGAGAAAPPSPLLSSAAGAPGGTRKYAVLTFDDGFRDFRENAWPVLAGHGFTATIFVPTSFIGGHRSSFKDRQHLSWNELRELQEHGMAVGSHSVNHRVLYGLPWSRIRKELRDSRQQLEHELQTAARFFAHPYAFPQEDRVYVRRFRQELVEEGYSGAVTTMIGRARAEIDPFCISRLPVNEGDDARLFAAKLHGFYDWTAVLQRNMRIMKRAVRAALPPDRGKGGSTRS